MRIIILLLVTVLLSAVDSDAPRSYSLTLNKNGQSYTVVWLLNFKDVVGIVQTPTGADVKDIIYMKSDKNGISLMFKNEVVQHGSVIIYNGGNIKRMNGEDSKRVYEITNSLDDSNRDKFESIILEIINQPGG